MYMATTEMYGVRNASTVKTAEGMNHGAVRTQSLNQRRRGPSKSTASARGVFEAEGVE